MGEKWDKMLRSVCQFLTLDAKSQLSFLPRMDNLNSYILNDCGDKTGNPLLYYCYLASDKILARSYRGIGERELQSLIMDMQCILNIMIEQRATYPCIWLIDKTQFPIFGDAERLWSVLRRLAKQVLDAKGWPMGTPEIPFAEAHIMPPNSGRAKYLAWKLARQAKKDPKKPL